MARVSLTKQSAKSIGSGGDDITAISYTLMATGQDNGVEFGYGNNDVIWLNNPTGGSAIYSIDLQPPEAAGELGITVQDATITVAAAQTIIIKGVPSSVAWSDGLVRIDCDVAANIAVLA